MILNEETLEALTRKYCQATLSREQNGSAAAYKPSFWLWVGKEISLQRSWKDAPERGENEADGGSTRKFSLYTFSYCFGFFKQVSVLLIINRYIHTYTHLSQAVEEKKLNLRTLKKI